MYSYNQLTLSTFPLIALCFLVIMVIYKKIANLNFSTDASLRKLFMWGIFIKLTSGLLYGGVYEFYYHFEGDTFSYFRNSNRLAETFFYSPSTYFKIFFNTYEQSNRASLWLDLYNPFYYHDPTFVRVHSYLSIFAIPAFKNYYIQLLLMNAFLYIVSWKFFIFLKEIFTEHVKVVVITTLFIPSVLFWGSGLIKDPFTFYASQLIVIYFYKLFFKYKIKIRYVIILLLAAYVVMSLKPYILYVTAISCLIWKGFGMVKVVESKFLRVIILPISLLFVGVLSIFVFKYLTTFAGGTYGSIDTMMQKAAVASEDLKQDYYGGQAFDIGTYDGTTGTALKMAPKAVIAGLFRPFIWEARSATSAISGLENLILLWLTLQALFRFKTIVKLFEQYPFLIFCFCFSLTFAFGVGLSTSNFGALARFKIPLLPYFALILLIIRQTVKEQKKRSFQ